MKQIYKSMISIFIISILVIAFVSAMRNDAGANTNQENALGGLTIQPIPFSSVNGKIDTQDKFYTKDIKYDIQISNYTFYLERPSYVYIDASGNLGNYNSVASFGLGIDSPQAAYSTGRTYGTCSQTAPYSERGRVVNPTITQKTILFF